MVLLPQTQVTAFGPWAVGLSLLEDFPGETIWYVFLFEFPNLLAEGSGTPFCDMIKGGFVVLVPLLEGCGC